MPKVSRASARDALALLRTLTADAHLGRAVPNADWYRLVRASCYDLAEHLGMPPIDLDRRALLGDEPDK